MRLGLSLLLLASCLFSLGLSLLQLTGSFLGPRLCLSLLLLHLVALLLRLLLAHSAQRDDPCIFGVLHRLTSGRDYLLAAPMALLKAFGILQLGFGLLHSIGSVLIGLRSLSQAYSIAGFF